ncbi:MAG: glutathione S-transferase family protein [Gammaproteobacteria bacterium]|nr:glutathione S-transferase family protein [Gammaproteobacteria bacterium]
MPADLVLYTNPQSRGRIARWMLEEVGADYETVLIEYGDAMKSPEYLKINPMGKVPAIVHHGQVVTESAAICLYLADAFPASGLAPGERRAAYYRWMLFAAGPIEAAATNRTLGFEVPADRESMVGYGTYERMIDALSGALSRHPYIAGDTFTATDVYVGSFLDYGLLEHRPVFDDYLLRLRARDAFKRAKAIDDALVESATHT